MKKGKRFLILILLFVTAHIAGFWAGRIICPAPEGEVIGWSYRGTVLGVEQEENGDVILELRRDIVQTPRTIRILNEAYRLGERDIMDLEIGEFIDMNVSLVEYAPEPVCIAYWLE